MLDKLKDATTWNRYRDLTNNNPIKIERISFDGDDLSEYDFQYVYFKHCSFVGAKLRETNFRNSIAFKCNFKEAQFWKTCFEHFDARSCLFTDLPINCWMENVVLAESQMRLIERHLKKFTLKPREEFTEEYADGLYQKIWNDPANF